MKYVLGILLIATTLCAQISNPLEIAPELTNKKYTGQRSYKIINDEVFLTYNQDSSIYFTKIDAENNQITTLVEDSLYYYLSSPAIEVLDNGNIIIVYSKIVDYDNGFLHRALSSDSGETFNVVSYQLDAMGEPHIVKRENSLDICYSHDFKTKSLAEFEYYTIYEQFENPGSSTSGYVLYGGNDILYGHVHSNDDIWFMNAGGGNNGGWPTFYGMITTTGRFRRFPGGGYFTAFELECICYGGWEEEVPPYFANGSNINAYGIELGNLTTDIVYVNMANGTFECMFGEIVEVGIEEFDVYSWYPHNAETANAIVNAGGNWFEDADLIYTNEITIYDTIWTQGPSYPANNSSFWIPNGELWIEGEVSGSISFGCADTVYIVGDITYADTPVGNYPDGFSGIPPGGIPQYNGVINSTDYFGLVSEKRIYIKYKHKDPTTGEIISNNCDGNVYLYGAYAALGIGDTLLYGNMACHYDGIVSFEYQHPHGSTPDFTALSPYTLQETLYTYIDLHKYVYPISEFIPPDILNFNLHGGAPVVNGTCGFPYEDPNYINSYPNTNSANYVVPYGTDYPWYNPIWPESSDDIVFERGIIHIYGSVAQTRRGFMHRSGSDPYNHPPGENEWDLEQFHYDGTHPSCGYDKDYYYDNRFKTTQPPNYPFAVQAPEIPREINVLHSDDGGESFQPSYVENVEGTVDNIWMDSDGVKVLVAYKSMIEPNVINFLISDDNPEEFTHYSAYSYDVKLKNAHILGNIIYILVEGNETEAIIEYHINSFWPDVLQVFEPSFHLADFTVTENGTLAYVQEDFIGFDHLNLDYYYDNEVGILTGFQNWQHYFGEFSHEDSNISIQLDEDGKLYSIILIDDYFDNYSLGELYLISGELEGIMKSSEIEFIPTKTSLHIFPNPFNPSTTISFSLNTENTENTEIVIYNIKGQKVKQLGILNYELGVNEVVWQGTDMNNKAVASGIYLFQLKADNKILKTRKGLLLK